MEKEYRLRLKHKDLVIITRAMGNHLLRELPNREWDEELARMYSLFEGLVRAAKGFRGRRVSGLPYYSWWLKEHKGYVLDHIRKALARVEV